MSFEDYEKHEFQINGRYSIIVCPKEPAEGGLWIWKTEFFEAFNFAEKALLDRGFYLAYHCVSDMYGCPESIEMMKEFYDVAVNEYGLCPKPALFGFSRGGLYACNFALTYPDCVGMLYLDAPVLDVRSWPGGKFAGLGAPECWEECKRWYGIPDRDWLSFKGSPLFKAKELAETNVPILLVCGAVDRYVPYAENGYPFYKAVKEEGGRIARVIKPYCDHHPHGLYDTSAVCNFVMSAYGMADESGFAPNEISLNNARAVVYGDSITYGAYTAEGDSCPASRAEKRWIEHVAEHFSFASLTNYAQSGISVSPASPVLPDRAILKQYGRMEDADLVFIAAGTNDFGTDVPLGSEGDSCEDTFYGALELLCTGLREKYPSAGIIFITPIRRYDEKSNKLGLSLDDYRRAIHRVAYIGHGFTVIDGDKVPIRLDDPDFMKKHMLDGVHVDPETQKTYGELVISELERGEDVL